MHVLACVLVAAVLGAEETVSYVIRSGATEVGRETVLRDAEGVHIAGFQQRKRGTWTYEIVLQEGGDGALRWSVDSSGSDGDVRSTVEYDGNRLRVIEDSRESRRSLSILFGKRLDPLVHEGFVPGLLAELGRHVWELHQRGEVPERQEIRLVSTLDGGEVHLRVARVIATPGPGGGQTHDFLRIECRRPLPKRPNSVFLLVGADGALLRADDQDPGLSAVRVGFEGVPPAGPLHSTSVDEGPWREWLSPPTHATTRELGVRVAMRDGVELATDVYRPRAEGRFPTILVRTPYLRVSEASRAPVFVPRGYAVVVQDVRGRGKSGGVFEPLRREEADGSDTLDWIAAQPWSDGNVGMIGASYVAWVQWFAARSGNPHLKAIVPLVCPPDPHENFPYEGGAPMIALAWWAAWLDGIDENGILGGAAVDDWDAAARTLPLSDLDTAVETRRPFVDEWLRHAPDDDVFWEPFRYQSHMAGMNVAALHVSGWFDDDQPGTPMNYRLMRDQGPPGVRDAQYLILGPWGHGLNLVRRVGDVDFGDEAIIHLDEIALRFFDRHLKGIRNGIDEEGPVLAFRLGDDAWGRHEDWPPPDVEPTTLYLTSSGSAARRDGDGVLGLAPPVAGAAEFDALRSDPLDPRPIVYDFNDMFGASFTADWAELSDRDDVLDYTSPPLARDVAITGPIHASLVVSTDADDADIAVDVLRVYPDGSMRLLAAGLQRLRYRTGRDQPVPPGEMVRVTVDCWATSALLKAGERLRVQVSPSRFPFYARNLHTLEPPFSAARAVTATVRVHHEPARPSYLVLPVRGHAPVWKGE